MAGTQERVRYLSQAAATQMDVDLMGERFGFCVQQLMELAGLSSAAAVAAAYPLAEAGAGAEGAEQNRRVLVVAGPGNNGGDGLAAARHLAHFGYDVSVLWPKRSTREPFYALLWRQLEILAEGSAASGSGAAAAAAGAAGGGGDVLNGGSLRLLDFEQAADFPAAADDAAAVAAFAQKYDVVVDAIFGYSFRGDIRAPFDRVLNVLNASGLRVACVDVPSGWDIHDGNAAGAGLAKPDVLISLTAPKLCARFFRGRAHYLGGRFVPQELQRTYDLRLPRYPGADQVVLLPNLTDADEKAIADEAAADDKKE